MNIRKNKVQLIGIVDAPFIEILSDGTKLALLRIATSENYISANGEKVTEQMFHQCKAFGKIAEIIDKYCISRMEVAIEGVLINSVTKSNGTPIVNTSVHIREFLILTPRNKAF